MFVCLFLLSLKSQLLSYVRRLLFPRKGLNDRVADQVGFIRTIRMKMIWCDLGSTDTGGSEYRPVDRVPGQVKVH